MGLTVNIVQYGKETAVDLPEGATYEDVVSKIPNGKNLDIREGGVNVTEKKSQRVRDGARLTAAPRQVKQGS